MPVGVIDGCPGSPARTVLASNLRSHATTRDTYSTCADVMPQHWSPGDPVHTMMHAASDSAYHDGYCPAHCTQRLHIYQARSICTNNGPLRRVLREYIQAHAITANAATASPAPMLRNARSPRRLNTVPCGPLLPMGHTARAGHPPAASVAATNKRRSAQWHERAVAQTLAHAPGDRQQS